MKEGILNILFIILLFLAARGIFALYNDLKKVTWIEKLTEKEEIEEAIPDGDILDFARAIEKAVLFEGEKEENTTVI